VRAEEVEAARQAMGRSREAYRVIAAEVIDTAKEHLDRAPPRAREGRWARRSARLDAELAEG